MKEISLDNNKRLELKFYANDTSKVEAYVITNNTPLSSVSESEATHIGTVNIPKSQKTPLKR